MLAMISMIQGIPIPINEYNAIVPGSRIPEWFSHQNVGCSVNIELPPHWYNTKLMGLAFCVVLNFEAIHSYKSGMMVAEPGDCRTFTSWVSLLLNDDYCVYTDLDSLYVSPEGLRFIESDHTLFGYKSLARLETNAHYWFRKLRDTMVASFELMGSDRAVKKCGVRLVYEEDEKEGGCSCPLGITWPSRDDSKPPEGACDGFSSSFKIGFPLSPSSLMLPL